VYIITYIPRPYFKLWHTHVCVVCVRARACVCVQDFTILLFDTQTESGAVLCLQWDVRKIVIGTAEQVIQ